MIPNDQGSAGQLWLRGDEIEWSDVFSIRCAALTVRVFHQCRVRSVETVLFSFEGSDPHVLLPDLLNDAGTEKREEVDTSILENCIEKNFHVPNMKSGPPAEGGCNFE
jgi:hypothetical protein